MASKHHKGVPPARSVLHACRRGGGGGNSAERRWEWCRNGIKINLLLAFAGKGGGGGENGIETQ